MRFIPCALLLALSAVASTAFGEDVGRVRADAPTTVTVRGQVERLDPLRVAQKGGLAAKFVSGVKGTARWTWHGVVHIGGWLLDENDDIPSQRERRIPIIEPK